MNAISSRLEFRLTVAKPTNRCSRSRLDMSLIARCSVAGSRGRIQRAHEVVLHLGPIGLPEAVQLPDWIFVRPIDPQIDDRPGEIASYPECRRVHGPSFTAGRHR